MSRIKLNMMTIDTREIAIDDYVRRFRDAERVTGYCRSCDRYGRSWICPPFDYDVADSFAKYKNVLIVAMGIQLPCKCRSEEEKELIRGQRLKVENRLLELERQVGGMAFGFGGDCLYCRECAKATVDKCRHPDLARPSLESYGFDVCATLSELFDINLEWSNDGTLQRKLTFVGALFHSFPVGHISIEI